MALELLFFHLFLTAAAEEEAYQQHHGLDAPLLSDEDKQRCDRRLSECPFDDTPTPPLNTCFLMEIINPCCTAVVMTTPSSDNCFNSFCQCFVSTPSTTPLVKFTNVLSMQMEAQGEGRMDVLDWYYFGFEPVDQLPEPTVWHLV